MATRWSGRTGRTAGSISTPWIAITGINLPLALAGQEQVGVNVFKRFGVSEEELSENDFAGPAFLPWARMGNLQKWGGPLLLSWIQKQSALQLQLLRRMRSLARDDAGALRVRGVPASLAFIAKPPQPTLPSSTNPHANVTKVSEWGQYNGCNGCTGFYGEFQQSLLSRAVRLGVDRRAGEDLRQCTSTSATRTYNEMKPRSNDLAY